MTQSEKVLYTAKTHTTGGREKGQSRSSDVRLERDNHIRVAEELGRIACQKKTGYGSRNYAELAMQRVKRIFGNTMKARKLPQQKTEAWVTAVTLNQMTSLGMPVPVKI